MSKKPLTDMDLMLYADAELDAAAAAEVSAQLAADESARVKLEALRQVGEAVRTYTELETDRAEVEVPAFGDLWSKIERRIHANGAADRSQMADPVAAPAPGRAAARKPGLWAAVRRWFEEHRGYVLTGAVSAGAACAVMLALGPRERVVERVAGRGAVVNGTQVALKSQPPEVEDLEVYEGSGTILTIEPEGDDDSAAAVIWISSDDEENREGPL